MFLEMTYFLKLLSVWVGVNCILRKGEERAMVVSIENGIAQLMAEE
jgi:hypothetical protein